MRNLNWDKIKNKRVGRNARLSGCAFFGVSSQFHQSPTRFFSELGVSMEKKCLKCEDFLRHNDHEKFENLLFGQAGIWDYEQCHKTCWQGARLKYEQAQDKFYKENKEYLKARRALCTSSK